MQLQKGLYETLIDQNIEAGLARLVSQQFAISRSPVASSELPERVSTLVRHWVAMALRAAPDRERADYSHQICTAILNVLHEHVSEHTELFADPGLHLATPPNSLKSIRAHDEAEIGIPQTSVGETTLLTNAASEPSIGAELLTEIDSADEICIILAFIRWTGIRSLLAALQVHCERGRRLRVLTTTYTNSTEPRALQALSEIGAEIRVSYDTSSTRLHAKAWLFQRNTGFSTVFIGSSNLTHSAQVTGIEWNVRAAQPKNPEVVEKFHVTFETCWESEQFESYDQDHFASQHRQQMNPDTVDLTPFDIRPYPFQEKMLDRLNLERLNDRHNNLVVAATGTGKTLVAAMDYRRLRDQLPRARLLFVAHRAEILRQSRTMFRHILRDGGFGELMVDSAVPVLNEHLFASIQSLHEQRLENFSSDHFDVMIIDEFHHAEAGTYQRLLNHFQPRELLGLTATPERADGQDILRWFDHRIAVELRLWDALEQQLLSPFHYFGIADETDLTNVSWNAGAYNASELTNVYTANDLWVGKVLQATKDIVADPQRMRAIGFCVSIQHAQFMADKFSSVGISAKSVTSHTGRQAREAAIRALANGEVQILFTVDLFNEGVDLPAIDTLLLLRPTSSATVFLQQLGRGLRRSAGKDVLTVLDFIGQQHRKFRFDQKYMRLLSRSRSETLDAVKNNFPYLPAGCAMHLDRQSSELVLDNIKKALPNTVIQRASELRSLGNVSLSDYLDQTGLSIEDVYRSNHYWTSLKQAAGQLDPPSGETATVEAKIGRAIGRLLHLDDLNRLQRIELLLANSEPPDCDSLSDIARRELTMLLLTVLQPQRTDNLSIQTACDVLWRHKKLVAELRELLVVLRNSVTQSAQMLIGEAIQPDIPLHLHARYSRDEILAAYGTSTVSHPQPLQAGVYWCEAHKTDLLFITLDKSNGGFSPTTRYRDYAINPKLFHWESQSTTKPESATGQRYINHSANNSNVALFVRERTSNELNNAMPYCALGTARYVRHRGSQPMAIIWQMNHTMPAALFTRYRAAVA